MISEDQIVGATAPQARGVVDQHRVGQSVIER